MNSQTLVRTAFGPTTMFVLLWSSGALFAKWGLASASPILFTALRFALALAVLAALALFTRESMLPRPGTRWQVARTGFVLSAVYAITYLMALEHGVAPGVLATILGVQPILTLMATERPLSSSRIAGLLLALGGLMLVVMNSIASARFALLGSGFALLALGAMTYGTLEQKKIDQPPASVLPLQYAVSIATCMLLMPLETVRIEFNASLLGSLFAMGVVISVAATLVFYRLIRAGNLVNVTSLFYLVPAGTAALDWLVFGNVMAPAALAGMAAIVAGLLIVFRRR